MTDPPEPASIDKKLLHTAMGVDLLAYVLGLNKEDTKDWLNDEARQLKITYKAEAAQLLHELIQTINLDEKLLVATNLRLRFSQYQKDYKCSWINALKSIATELPPPQAQDTNMWALLEALARSAYPLYLIPESSTSPFSMSGATSFLDPLCQDFQNEIMANSTLSQLFPLETAHSGKYGHCMRSTGKGGSVQLSTLADTLIASGWRAAKFSEQVSHPSIDQHVQGTLLQLRTIKLAMEGKEVYVPAHVAFTGVGLESDREITLDQGIMRKTTPVDQELVRDHIEGDYSYVNPQGVATHLSYSGDVVLSTKIRFKLQCEQFNHDTAEWPKGLRDYEKLQAQTENIQLGIALSQEFDSARPVTMLPTWRHIHDPLDSFGNIGWNDPKRARAIIPKIINYSEASECARFVNLINSNRVKNIDVSIQRTLRALAERTDYTDVLVDAVIAWENLFGSGGELTLRISGSLAWLLRNEPTTREELRAEISKLYSLRGSVVHGTAVESNQDLTNKALRALAISVDALRVLFTTRTDLLRCRDSKDRSYKLLMGG